MGKPAKETPQEDKEALELKCKEFPNSKILLISAKRPGAFLVRTASELLAGGTEVLILSALGDAMPLAIQLQMTLINKNAATTIRIETCLNKRVNTRGKHDSYTPGLQIYMRKHPEYKGSRISPGHVAFANKPENAPHTPLYDSTPTDRVCSTLAGSADFGFSDNGTSGEMAKLLLEAEHAVQDYKTLFTALALDARKAHEADAATFVATMSKCDTKHPDLKFALCRLPRNPELLKENEGLVFICIFKHKYPGNDANNMGFVYVVAPNGKNYSNEADFYTAMHETGENFMTALCDYNGIVKRGGSKTMQWMTTCRVCLVGGGANIHPKGSKLEVAKNLLNGIAEGYRHGPAPRLSFSYDEDIFRSAWQETTGLVAPQPTA
ncbi:Alba-like domain superfamily [Babesia duncani]|uniref:Alba-like domain superfamily n=1 Tax=Babesia duncani TaxID=323732 RepID=A0AAD9PIK7_9APIC|nr:Alba-like domain superfamily [Babesia duncani]